MILADHFISQKREKIGECIPDDGRAQVPYMHLLRHIGTGVIDDNFDGIRLLFDTDTGIRKDLARLFSQPGIIKPNIDKPRSGNLNSADKPLRIDQLGYLSSDLSGVTLEWLGKRHNTIELIISKFRFRCLGYSHTLYFNGGIGEGICDIGIDLLFEFHLFSIELEYFGIMWDQRGVLNAQRLTLSAKFKRYRFLFQWL